MSAELGSVGAQAHAIAAQMAAQLGVQAPEREAFLHVVDEVPVLGPAMTVPDRVSEPELSPEAAEVLAGMQQAVGVAP